MVNQSELDRLLQKEWRENVIPNMSRRNWITVYQKSNSGRHETLWLRSAFIPNCAVKDALSSPSWSPDIEFLEKPYMENLAESEGTFAGDPESGRFPYERFNNDKGIEPFVIVRHFLGLKSQKKELLEEFRLFHNLRFKESNCTYIKYDDVGDEIEVVKVCKEQVRVRRKEIRQFLTARNISLVVCFDKLYWSRLSIDEVCEHKHDENKREKNSVYRFFVRSEHLSQFQHCKSLSRIYGKVAIGGVASVIADEDAGKYVDFIIGVDENERPITYTCNPTIVDSIFQTTPTQASLFLKRVYFKREVLAKYYHKPSKYTVENGLIRSATTPDLKVLNSRQDYVIVFLGDLANLPYREQKHWQSFNVLPDYGATRPIHVDIAFRFQSAYCALSKYFEKLFGWHLFKPLPKTDSHHLKVLRIPLTDEPSELDEVMLSLSKLIVDSINVKQLKKEIPNFQQKDQCGGTKRSIVVFEEWLNSQGYNEVDDFISCLRTIQSLRSAAAAHRKGKNYDKVSETVGLDTKTPAQVADNIFTTLTEFLDSLREHFCPDEED